MKQHLKMSPAKWCPFHRCLNVSIKPPLKLVFEWVITSQYLIPSRCIKLCVAHAPGMLGMFFPLPTSKEIANWRSRHASRPVRHACALMVVGISNQQWREKRFPAFSAHAQPANLRFWKEAQVMKSVEKILYRTKWSSIYTLCKKGCYTPIEDNKTNVDRTFVFPLGWNWHDMDPWLFPNEIRHYHGQTINARSSGIVELRNHSIGGRSPKSIFTLWHLWINICIFFQKYFWLFEQCPV